MPRLKTESFSSGDQSWLGSTHGLRNARTETLDISAFTPATHYPNGYIPSGTPVAKVGGVLVPYDGTEATTTNAGVLAGFVLTFGPGSDYDSENYRWFAEQYGSGFLYLDRIVVDDRFRRRGLASRVYDRVEARAAASGLLALEVNVDPPNEPSLAFHRARGFVEVGTMGPQGHRVSLMVKELAGR